MRYSFEINTKFTVWVHKICSNTLFQQISDFIILSKDEIAKKKQKTNAVCNHMRKNILVLKSMFYNNLYLLFQRTSIEINFIKIYPGN